MADKPLLELLNGNLLLGGQRATSFGFETVVKFGAVLYAGYNGGDAGYAQRVSVSQRSRGCTELRREAAEAVGPLKIAVGRLRRIERSVKVDR